MGKIKGLLKKQSKGETILLAILSVVAMVLGFLILVGVLSVRTGIGILSMYPNGFALVLIGVGVLGIFLSFYNISKGK